MNEQLFMMIPGLQPEEVMLIKELTKDMSEKEIQHFIMFYQGRRKEQQTLLIFALLGFFGVAGIHRLVTGDTALGIVYLLTIGFCGIGTIVDVININTITNEFNRKQAIESARMVKMMNY